MHNDELNTIFLGEEFGNDMQRMFDADLQEATPIDRTSWEARGVVDRLGQRLARLLRHWL